jgi:Tfp pilus assembly protein FimT
MNRHGLTLAELLVVASVIAITVVLTIPMLLTYWHASTLTGGAQELMTILNGARQLAIRQNTNVCVERSGSTVRYRVGGCGGTVWTGPGTDASGWRRLANGVEIVNQTATVVFSYLGAANPAGTYRVRNPRNTAQTQTVTVAASGRVKIP